LRLLFRLALCRRLVAVAAAHHRCPWLYLALRPEFLFAHHRRIVRSEGAPAMAQWGRHPFPILRLFEVGDNDALDNNQQVPPEAEQEVGQEGNRAVANQAADRFAKWPRPEDYLPGWEMKRPPREDGLCLVKAQPQTCFLARWC
jgi:hypothetical protein